MNPTYEPYPTKQEALVLFQFQEKELVVYDKAKWHYEGEFPQELDISQA
ncbi:hypothetical protein M5W83_13220 [Paenibacillus thiaminolyticus]|uniref:Uncharacterized protein n=1 Tax=Paenibacillus thiaminolyticus TaxID=49283 RepID=A0ABT4FVA3_PANTH|nr:hypothetical protein [Paenibacillus thiaminolyticus]MCY9608102.1 hypothetical protein [Paenibacillus thiaminolyticus]MCY9622005.1 hypothetical protein [Paenibacillus thiaminolyticus]MCY9624593.1 hypothetical protein [Paenibacillus thiaminolyticus]MCY9639223.1 hypothetical protein [Paenibacillus thiaminolyticus]MCY9649797.1 hypothetical protein [Paenibacillus thiaminolyticus]